GRNPAEDEMRDEYDIRGGVRGKYYERHTTTIRAAVQAEVTRSSVEWAFADLGFASKAKSCGLLVGDDEARVLTFSELRNELVNLAKSSTAPLNLLLEAPLSVSFGASGNPVGRSVEVRDGKSRYWYVGLGCGVLVAATYLLRAVYEARPTREI